MKKVFILASVVLVSTISFGQKKELKKADKAIKSEKYTEAMTYIGEAESLLGSADNSMKSMFYLTKGRALFGAAGTDLGKIKEASESFKMAKELDTDGSNASTIRKQTDIVKSSLEQGATMDYKNKDYKMAALKFYTAYNLSPNDTLFLFNAAISSKIDKDFDSAEIYLKTLADIEYTGMQKQFIAINKDTGKEEPFSSKSSRD